MANSNLQSGIDAVINQLATGLSARVGERFCVELVCFLGQTLKTKLVYIGRVNSAVPKSRVDTVALALDGVVAANISYELAGTPCEGVVSTKPCVHALAVQHEYPQDNLLAQFEAESYVGVPLISAKSGTIGILAVIDVLPMEDAERTLSILLASAPRVTAELERINVEEKLKRSEERYALALEASSVGSWEWDVCSNTMHWSPGIERLFGVELGEFDSSFDSYMKRVFPEDRMRLSDAMNAALHNNEPFAVEYRVVWPCGTIRWLFGRGKVLRDERGVAHRMIGIVWDSTDQKAKEERLRRSETSMTEAQQVALLGSWEWDIATDSLWWSDQLYRLYGYSACSVEPSYERYVSHVHPDDKAMVQNAVDRLADPQHKPERLRYRVVRVDGSERVVFDQVRVVRNASGSLVRVVGAVQDVTDQMHAAAALDASNAQLKSINEAIPDMVIVYRKDGRILDVNDQFCETTGFDRGEVPSLQFDQLCGEGFSWEMAKGLMDQVIDGQDLDFEWVARKKNGDEFPVEVRLRKSGAPLSPQDPALVAVVRDLTARKRVDSVIAMLAQSAADVSTDQFLRDCVRYLTRAYQAKFAFVGRLVEPDKRQVETLAVWAGDNPAPNFVYELKGTPCADVLDRRAEIIPQDAWRLYSDDVLLKDMRVESYLGAPLIAADGRILGLVAVMDVRPMVLDSWVRPVLGVFATRLANEIERDEAMRELDAYRERLEERVCQRTDELRMVNRELEAFAYSVSHDLRAPLRAIDGFSRALEEDYKPKLDSVAQQYIDRVRSGAQRMGDLIDAMLRLSRISRAGLRRVNVDVSTLAANIFQDQCTEELGNRIEFQVQPGLSTSADPNLLRIAIENLLSNAVKYTRKQARATVSVTATEQSGQQVFCVSDNGVGFNMDYSEKLFGAFQRLHGTNEFEGLGIGLATVQRVIHRHGGLIWAEAEEGKGARFYFTLSGRRGASENSSKAA